MPRGIYLIKDEDIFVTMTEQQYDSEDLLQGLLDKYPLLLAGDQINSEAPRQWLPLARESGVSDSTDGSDRWYVDNLFLDQDGVLTIVEVKRSSDPRLRREVVGQILDYAANAVVYWTIDSIRSKFEERCRALGADPDQELVEKLDRSEAQEFWQDVSANLEAGKIRMLFVADHIPSELQRIVEFLNEQMKDAEMLAIEIKQYVGEGHKTLVPRVVGQTAKSQVTKGGPRQKRKWDEQSFFEGLKARSSSDDAQIARKVFEWVTSHGFNIWWGEGARDGSLVVTVVHNALTYYTISIWTSGAIEIAFQWLRSKPPFDQESKRINLQAKLNEIPSVNIPSDAINRRPSFPLAALKDETALNQFFTVLKWIVEEIEKIAP
jgi:hypothetical protein